MKKYTIIKKDNLFCSERNSIIIFLFFNLSGFSENFSAQMHTSANKQIFISDSSKIIFIKKPLPSDDPEKEKAKVLFSKGSFTKGQFYAIILNDNGIKKRLYSTYNCLDTAILLTSNNLIRYLILNKCNPIKFKIICNTQINKYSSSLNDNLSQIKTLRGPPCIFFESKTLEFFQK